MNTELRYLFLSFLLLISIGFRAPDAWAQGTPIATPPNPVWTTPSRPGPKTAPTPDEACRIQHATYAPTAIYQLPVKDSESKYWCQWNGGLVNPTLVTASCGTGYAIRNGLCVDVKTETPDCDCPNNSGSLRPTSPMIGDPVSATSGHLQEQEADYVSADGRFGVVRHYSSNRRHLIAEGQFGFGSSWSGLIPGRLFIAGTNASTVEYETGNGGAVNMMVANNAANLNDWTFKAYSMTSLKLSMVTTPSVTRPSYRTGPAVLNGPGEFKLQKDNGEHILFRRAGPAIGSGRYAVPVERGAVNGYRIFYDYPDTDYYPNRIRDTDGREMLLTWKAAPLPDAVGRYPQNGYKVIEKITLPDSTELHYDYDAANTVISGAYSSTNNVVTAITINGPSDRLIAVRRKTATGTVLWGRDYLYENSRFPYAMTGIKDVAGNRLNTFVYNNAGQVASSEMAGGVIKHSFKYLQLDAENIVTEVENPLGRIERYNTHRKQVESNNYNDMPRVLTQIDGLATSSVPADVRKFEYQKSTTTGVDFTLVRVFDANNVKTTYTPDMVNRRPTAIIEATARPEQRQTNITYWPNTNLPASITVGYLKTEFTYSAGGQILTQKATDLGTQSLPYATGGQVRLTSYAWNANGRIESVNGPLPVDANGKDDTLSYSYNSSGNLLTVTNGLGHITSFSNYDLNGRAQQSTDANGVVTLYNYDPLGRLSSMTVKDPVSAAQDAVTTFTYDSEGRVTGISRPGTDTLNMDYDLAGQLIALHANSGERIDFTYNAAGGVTSQTVKRADGSTARSTTRTFDSLNRVLTETLGPGRTTSWSYDKEGNPVQLVTPLGRATVAAFDGLNRLVSTAHPGGGSETQSYTPLDDVATNSDALSVTTTFVRNGFGEAIQEVSPDRGTSVYYYDAAGRVSAVIDGRGQRINYTRDILGRVTAKTPVGRPSSEGVSYVYDDNTNGAPHIGRLTAVIDGSGTTRLRYDHRGNLLAKGQSVGATALAELSYQYDLADRIVQITYPSGRLVAYDRDSKGRVLAVRTKASAAATTWTNVASNMAYEPFASLKKAPLGNGLVMTNDWGNDGRLAFRRLKTNTGVSRSLLSYSYDNDDNITAITDDVTPANSRAYGYDTRGRLAQAVVQTGSAAFAREDYLYDANGNRTAVERRIAANDTIAAQTDSYTRTAGTNRLASITGALGTRNIQYDARGNTLSESRTGGSAVTASYDGHGRLISYARTGEETQTNIYNGMDQRVVVSSGLTTRRFVYDPDGRVIGEYGSSALDVIAERIWMTPVTNDSGMFGGDDGTGGFAPIAIVTGSTLTWVHANHMGVPQLYTDASGAVVATPTYTLPGFPGQFRTYADLYYNKYRDYDVSTGRYIQADPIGLAGGQSPYSYAMGNPLRYSDPTGEIVPLILACAANPLCRTAAGAVAWGIADALLDYTMQRMVDGRSHDCIDWSSVAFSAGVGALTGGIGGIARVKRGASEFSHWIPERYINPNSQSYKPWLDKGPIRKFINSPWNGNHVPRWFHGKTDFWRRPAGSRVADKWPFPVQQVLRAPTWVWAPAATTGIGATGANGDD